MAEPFPSGGGGGGGGVEEATTERSEGVGLPVSPRKLARRRSMGRQFAAVAGTRHCDCSELPAH